MTPGVTYDPITDTFILIGKITDTMPTEDMIGIEIDADYFVGMCAASTAEAVRMYRSARALAVTHHDDVAAHVLRGGVK